jgi:hypothetical protein
MNLEITSRDNLEYGISVVLKVKNVVIGFILSFIVSIPFGSKEPHILITLVAFYQNGLTKQKMRTLLVL